MLYDLFKLTCNAAISFGISVSYIDFCKACVSNSNRFKSCAALAFAAFLLDYTATYLNQPINCLITSLGQRNKLVIG